MDDLVVVDEEETLEHLLHHLLDIACAHKDRLTTRLLLSGLQLSSGLGFKIRIQASINGHSTENNNKI